MCPNASGGEVASSADGWVPKPGEVVGGKFVVERLLGVGGMGVVVAARHAHLDQTVAIKFLRRDAASDEAAVNRFLREARAVAILQSEHVVRVMDAGRLDDGLPYLVMEYLAGKDLDGLLAERVRLPLEEAVGYLLQAMEAVAEAHAAGIVHRDLKPSNLFVTTRPDGSSLVKVLDFGISKALDASIGAPMSLTATSMTLGSPLYMSPEQVRSSKNVDVRIDIWALGVIAYELLAGVPPFEAETVTGLCAKIVADEPSSLRSVRPDVDPAFEAIILRCLEKNVAARYQSVRELAAALKPFASAEGRASVQRIGRIGTGSKATLASALGVETPASAKSGEGDVGYAETVASWQTAGGKPTKRVKRATATILGGLALVACAVVAAKWPRAAPAPASANPVVTATPTLDDPLVVAKPSVALLAPAPSTSASDAPVASASASSAPLHAPSPPPAQAPVQVAVPRPASVKPVIGPVPRGKTPDELLLDRK